MKQRPLSAQTVNDCQPPGHTAATDRTGPDLKKQINLPIFKLWVLTVDNKDGDRSNFTEAICEFISLYDE